MKVVLPFALLVLLIASGACKKPVLEITEKVVPPLVLSTSIQDSLPHKAVQALDLSHVVGLKVKYASGLYSDYFEYDADRNLLLVTIAELPFTIQGVVADTRCHPLSFEEMMVHKQNLSPTEISSAEFFWTTDPTSIDVFECIKPPFRHTLQVGRNSNRILHRIEFLGHS
jgi:hypothetical protein